MKKSIALLLSLVLMLGLLSSCNNTGDAGSSSTPTPTPASSNPSQAPEYQGTGEDDEITFPLADKVEFSIWNGPYSVEAGMTDPGDSYAYQEAEKRTNIHIKWDQPATGMAIEQFNLIVASGTFPDSFMGATYVGGLDKFVNDDIIIDMRPYLEKYAPSFFAMANIDEITFKKNLTDEGRIPGFYNLSYIIEPTFWGPQMREDWLQDLGIDTPKTINDWYNTLTAFKEQKGSAFGYMLPAVHGCDDAILSAYDLIYGFYADADGKVHYGPYEDAFRDYVTEMTKWYSEGLIDPEFNTRPVFNINAEQILNGEAGAWKAFWTSFDPHKMQAAEESFQGVAVPVPVLNAGDKRELTIYGVPDSRVGTAVDTISTQCEEVEILIKWYDYFFSDEGEILADYGVEGQAHEIIGGKPVFTELITNNPDGLAQNHALSLYTIGSTHSRQYDWARQITPAMSHYGTDAGAIWDGNWDRESGYASMQGVTLTSAESDEYTPMYNDITTFISENVVAMILGAKTLDNLEFYYSELKVLGIERCIELYQQAYDRYQNR